MIRRSNLEEFRQVCEQVTENGDGKYYGMVASGAQKNRMDIELRAFSEVGGAKLGPAGQVFLQEESDNICRFLKWFKRLTSIKNCMKKDVFIRIQHR